MKAEDGERGATKEMTGRGGEDTIVLLPVGTLVTDAETGELIVDLSRDGDEFLLCEGGKGGFGNAHFTSSTRQAPNFAELGDEGGEIAVQLELKLVADVGLIGMPNAGKSSLISSITNVRPKIANYPFTTLIPNLGVMEYKGRGLLIEDVPGLIEGASEGR
jgi:GTP-binding protein